SGVPALGAGNDVIVSGVLATDPLGAVLALPVVAGVDVLPAELDRPLAIPHRAEEADDRGHLHRKRHRPDQTVLVLLDHLHLSEEQEVDRPLPRNTGNRLVPRAENQGLHGRRIVTSGPCPRRAACWSSFATGKLPGPRRSSTPGDRTSRSTKRG